MPARGIVRWLVLGLAPLLPKARRQSSMSRLRGWLLEAGARDVIVSLGRAVVAPKTGEIVRVVVSYQVSTVVMTMMVMR